MDLNPYAPAAAGGDAITAGINGPHASSRPIRFGGAVREADIALLGKSRIGIVVACLLVILGAVVFLLMLAGPGTGSNPGRRLRTDVSLREVTIMGVILVPLPLWLLSRSRGNTLARRLQQWSPRIVGPVEGMFSEQTVELAYPELRSVIPLQSLTGVRLSPQFIAFTYDYHQMQLCVLPSSLFEQSDLSLVHERLAPLAAERPWLPGSVRGLDPRPQHRDPLELIPRVADAVNFAGTLLFSDFAATAIYRQQMRRTYRFFAVLGVLAVAVAVCSGVLTQSTRAFLFATVLLAVSLSIHLARWRQHLKRHFPSGDQVVARLSGFLSDAGLTVNSAIGSTTYQRSAFPRVVIGESSVELILRSRIPQVIILKASMFQSPDDFQQVRHWVTESAATTTI